MTTAWFERIFPNLARELRWSYLPPLMIYLAAGVSGLTAIVGTFFAKEFLDLSASFLAGLAFWAGIPWTLKMPLGHLVDLIWRWKSWLVVVGACVIALALLIMYALVAHSALMTDWASVQAWYVASVVLAPTGYVIQDVVADAMTVEAVPLTDDDGEPYGDAATKRMHTTMQTLGRFAVVTGGIAVSVLNIAAFSDIDGMSRAEVVATYSDIYLMALVIPLISISGVALSHVMLTLRARKLRQQGFDDTQIRRQLFAPPAPTHPNWGILLGSIAFVALTLAIGLAEIPRSQEIVFVGGLAIVVFLIYRLVQPLESAVRRALLGTAIVIFAFRAVPLPGPGLTWFEIDVLAFDQRFIAVLSLIASVVALVVMLILRPVMAKRSIAFIIVLLSVLSGLLMLPNIALYYGFHHWTSALTGGIVDARFIAIIDTAAESPLVHIAMIPMLAWIAKYAPPNLKATFFAVMASFSNLALSASSLATKYLNQLFVVTREVRDRTSEKVVLAADYDKLGWLLICVALIAVIVPIAIVLFVQRSPLRTEQ